MSKLTVAATVLAFILSNDANGDDARPATPEWKAGVASVKITPDEMMWLTGYASRTKPAEGVALDLFAKALAIEDRDGHRAVIVTTDLIGIPRRLRDDVAAAVKEKHKLPPKALLLNASHTHCGPELLASDESETDYSAFGLDAARVAQGRKYLIGLRGKLVDLVGQSLQNLAPSRLVYTHARAGFAMNRRLPTPQGVQNSPYPDGPVDHDVPVLQVRAPDGKEMGAGTLKAVLFGYACHNTTLGFQQFCGDYAGYAQAHLQELHPEATAMFLMGCGGDQNPYPRGELSLCQHHGKTLALAVETALQTKQTRDVHGPLKTALAHATLEFAPAPAKEELQKLTESKDRYDRRRGVTLLKQLETNGRIHHEYEFPVQVIQFGNDITLVALAGETVVDYSLRLKKELAGKAAVWVAGYSNDVFGYVPSQRVLEEGGYEGGGAMKYTIHPGPFLPSVEDRIFKAVHRLLKADR